MKPKDEALDAIVQQGGNIAQFVSFGPDGSKRYSRIRGMEPSHQWDSIEQAVDALFRTGTPFVNIRSFTPSKPDGNPFLLGSKEGLDTAVKAAEKVRELIRLGYNVIVNEDIAIDDGGFSGVLIGDRAEFASRDTPRCVEKKGFAVLPREMMLRLAEAVYGGPVRMPYPRDTRVEFSMHPGPVGYLRQRQIIWQVEQTDADALPESPVPQWPNRYSQDMGDKAYGILVAHLYGLRVPRTRVFGRIIPLFEFGTDTGSSQKVWVRTCPRAQQPGLYTTKHGWLDPYALMQREDPGGTNIASIIIQDSVDTAFAGAAITDATGRPIIEGVAEEGEAFMVGGARPTALPDFVTEAVTRQWERNSAAFGPVRFEWVMDTNDTLWTVQFHVGQSESQGLVIYPGEPKDWVSYDAVDGLPGFRQIVRDAQQHPHLGIILRGDVGITSHFGDILRRSKIPSRLERK